MYFGALSWIWLLITLIPLGTKPEFVVREIKACCHHQIGLKCEQKQGKLAIIQARYILASANLDPTKPWPEGESRAMTEFITLFDMDVKFVHDLLHEGRESKLSDLNSPNWMRQRESTEKIRRYTTPNPIPKGSNFSSNHILEVPPYEKKFLDKDAIWKQELFQTESETLLKHNISGSSESAKVHSFPCLSYESLLNEDNNKPKEVTTKPKWEYKDLRPVFNQRCSGRPECIVNLLRNKQKDQDLTRVCHKWPDGRIVVKYVCLDPTSGDVHSKCNENVRPAQEGFILNPGYPDLYPGDRPCQWRLRVEEQRLLLVFLDISLRGKEKLNCRDELMVNKDRAKLLSICGDQESAVAVLSPSDRLNVTFIPESRLAFPKRGFLLYFRVIGCGNPEAQLNSYLVFRNATHAYFHCDVGFFLPKTLGQTRWLTCQPLTRNWSSSSPECTDATTLLLVFGEENGNIPSIWPVINRSSREYIIFDYILPIVVLLLVLIGNGFVLLWIRTRLNRREESEDDYEEDEELDAILTARTPEETEESTFTLSSDGMEGTKPGGKPWDFLELTDLDEQIPLINGESETNIIKGRYNNGNGGIYLNGNGALRSFHYTSVQSTPITTRNENILPYTFPRTTPV